MSTKIPILILLFISFFSHTESTPKPNFIIIYLDDMGYSDVGIYKDKRLRTPNIDLLSNSGQVWTNFYSSSAVCTPSRAGLLTGRLPVRNGLYGNSIGVFFPGSGTGIPNSELTFAEVLNENGYSTGIFGKWHLGDKKKFWPTRHGFDEWVGIPYSNDMDWKVGDIDLEYLFRNPSLALEKYGEIAPKIVEKIRNPNIDDWNVPLQKSIKHSNKLFSDETLERPADQHSITKRFTEESLKYIEKSTKNNKSFFLFLSHSMPHVPLFRSDGFVDSTKLGVYADVLAEIDWSVGEILKKIKNIGIEENTYVIFTSDNGPWLLYPNNAGSAKPLRDGKGTTFEGGMRVMTIFKGPNIKTGIVKDIGSQLDFFTTILTLADIEPSFNPEDSYDLSKTLKYLEPSPRQIIPYFVGSELRAFRYKNHKIHFITQGAYNLPPKRMEHEVPILFNLTTDIGEEEELLNLDKINEINRQVNLFQEDLKIQNSLLDIQYIDLN